MIPVTRHPNKAAASEDINGVSLTGVGPTSLVTDDNSAFSGSSHLQRSGSMNNTESYNRLSASPMLFTSNNISIVDGSSVVLHNSHHDRTAQQIQKNQQGNPSVALFPQAQNCQLSLPMSGQIPVSVIQDSNNISHVQKKRRVDIKQEDILRQQIMQQLLQPDSVQTQNSNPQLRALFQQQRLQQQHILQSTPHIQRAHLQEQEQQQQQMQLQGIQPMNVLKRPNETSACARRMMQYLYYQRQRPADNSIAYWRNFVSEYYSPHARKRWCLSLYENVGQHVLGVFPQAAMDAWECDICKSKSGRGFEATFEALARFDQIKFASGVIDDFLFLSLPKEFRTPMGLMVLEYEKVVQQTLHEQLRVVREGHLRVVFTQNLKILSWEFCARRHEVLLPTDLIATQANQLLQVAQNCNNAITEAENAGVSSEDLQTSSNMVQPAWSQLAKTMELQTLNDLGYSKRYVRCLQISEVVNSMKDLIDVCLHKKCGPIDGLKHYPGHASTAKSQLQEMGQPLNVQGIRTDQETLNKPMAVHPSSGVGNNNHIINHGATSGGTPQASIALMSYQDMLMRQNSMNLTQSSSPSPVATQSMSNTKQLGYHVSGYPSHQLPPDPPTQQQLQEQRGAANLFGPHQYQIIQQRFQDIPNNGGGRGTRTGLQQQNNSPQTSTSNVSGDGARRNNSFKEAVASNRDSPRPSAGGTNWFNSTTQDDILLYIPQNLTDSDSFSASFDDIGYEFN